MPLPSQLVVLPRAGAPWPAVLDPPSAASPWPWSDVVTCASAGEVIGALRSGPPVAAVVLDADHAATDRDLIATARFESDAPVVVVDGRPGAARWLRLGASGSLRRDLTGTDLADLLAGSLRSPPQDAAPLGPLVAVLGSAGGGSSTVAMAAAQALGAHARPGAPPVVLTDLARRSHQLAHHGIAGTGPAANGIDAILEAFERGAPTPAEVLDFALGPPRRAYRLVRGFGHHLGWIGVRPHALDAALGALRAAATAVVADIDADLEGETETGSLDIEDRNRLARAVARSASIVVVVTATTTMGLDDLRAIVDDARALGVDDGRVLLVANHPTRSRPGGRRFARAVAEVTGARSDQVVVLPYVAAVRRGHLPRRLVRPLALAIDERFGPLEALSTPAPEPEPTPIAPGSLGHWSS